MFVGYKVNIRVWVENYDELSYIVLHGKKRVSQKKSHHPGEGSDK